MKKVAISVGDLNGIGIQLALENHHLLCKMIKPLYCIDQDMLTQAAIRLNIDIPDTFQTIERVSTSFKIQPSTTSKMSGAYSYASFCSAVALARADEVNAICTLPIHKKAWELAKVPYKGHTDALRQFFQAEAIMMLGCPQMYVALYTEHIPLKEVASQINEPSLVRFLINFYHTAKPSSTVAVLGLNPHAGDDGVLGDEERIIESAIRKATHSLKTMSPPLSTEDDVLFTSPMVPDVAFTPHMRARYTHYIAMYHDQGLTPLKALYFDEGINVSLNLPILRTSVDHGTAFDIAYSNRKVNSLSYLNAIRYIAEQKM